MKDESNLKGIVLKILFVITVLALIGYLIYLTYPKNTTNPKLFNIVRTYMKDNNNKIDDNKIENYKEPNVSQIAEDVNNDKYVWYHADATKNENILELDNKILLDKVILRRFINKDTNDLYYLVESPHYVRENGYIYQDEVQYTKLKDYNEYIKEEYATISKDETFFKEGDRGREVLLTVKDSYTNKKIIIFVTKSGISTVMEDINED